jgi:hypothetical protein
MKKIKCLFAGHAWRLSEEHNLDSGKLQTVEVSCSRCRATTGRHWIKLELTSDELAEQRKFFIAMRDAFASLNATFR